jgi:hypothetical protein
LVIPIAASRGLYALVAVQDAGKVTTLSSHVLVTRYGLAVVSVAAAVDQPPPGTIRRAPLA